MSNFNVGFLWNSPQGIRRIEDILLHPHTGDDTAFVSTDGRHSKELIPLCGLQSIVQTESANYESRMKAREREAELAQAKAQRESWNGFTDSMSPLIKARAIRTLDTQRRVNGKFLTLGEAIEQLVSDGFIVKVDPKYKRRLISSETGNFFYEKDLSKIGLDYAEYLTLLKVKIG
jgi:hypothetical protein